MRPRIMIAYDATPEAADGLALGRLLANLVDGELHVARVLPDTPRPRRPTGTRRRCSAPRCTRRSRRPPIGSTSGSVELWPVFGTPPGPGIQALAADRGTDLIVLGSPHHGPVGRMLLGSTAEAVVAGAPCAVAVAPRRFRRRAAIEPKRDRRGVRRLVRVRRGARCRGGPRARRGRAPARDRRRAVGLEPAAPARGSGRRRRAGARVRRPAGRHRVRVRRPATATRPAGSQRRPSGWACSSAGRGRAARCAG